jgi:hypothetical protein
MTHKEFNDDITGVASRFCVLLNIEEEQQTPFCFDPTIFSLSLFPSLISSVLLLSFHPKRSHCATQTIEDNAEIGVLGDYYVLN